MSDCTFSWFRLLSGSVVASSNCKFGAMQLHVYLPSGNSCAVALPLESSVHELKVEAQQQLQRRFLRLLCGSEKLDPSRTLAEVGLRDGDSITAIAQHAKLSSTRRAFALYVEGGSVVTWGDPGCGGDSSQVREQLVQVQQIQATQRALAAIRADGSVATWGDLDAGGDSSQVQEQLVQGRSSRFKPPCVLLLPSWPTARW